MKNFRLFAIIRQTIVGIRKTNPYLYRLSWRTDKSKIRLRQFLHTLLHLISFHTSGQPVDLKHNDSIIFGHRHHPVFSDKSCRRKYLRDPLYIIIFITGKYIRQDFSHIRDQLCFSFLFHLLYELFNLQRTHRIYFAIVSHLCYSHFFFRCLSCLRV